MYWGGIMEKGPSEFAEYWTSELNEIVHFKRHGKQMGYTKIRDYSKAAQNFIKGGNNLSFTAKDGSQYYYNKDTNEFGIVSRNGGIVTYFPPSDGFEYFYNQFNLYGDYWN